MCICTYICVLKKVYKGMHQIINSYYPCGTEWGGGKL